MRLEGRKALVTGGASGIGAAIAARLAAEGAEVWVGDVDTEGAERVAGEANGHAIELDVTDLESARAAIEAVGTPDVLVNNAGTDEFGFFTYTTPEQWQRYGTHPDYGQITILEVCANIALHDINHIEQMARALALAESLID